MVSYFLAILCAAAACWLAIFQAERWQRKRHVLNRLNHRGVSTDEVSSDVVVGGIYSRLTASPLIESDYKEAVSYTHLTLPTTPYV